VVLASAKLHDPTEVVRVARRLTNQVNMV
jgi:hypothetical protein